MPFGTIDCHGEPRYFMMLSWIAFQSKACWKARRTFGFWQIGILGVEGDVVEAEARHVVDRPCRDSWTSASRSPLATYWPTSTSPFSICRRRLPDFGNVHDGDALHRRRAAPVVLRGRRTWRCCSGASWLSTNGPLPAVLAASQPDPKSPFASCSSAVFLSTMPTRGTGQRGSTRSVFTCTGSSITSVCASFARTSWSTFSLVKPHSARSVEPTCPILMIRWIDQAASSAVTGLPLEKVASCAHLHGDRLAVAGDGPLALPASARAFRCLSASSARDCRRRSISARTPCGRCSAAGSSVRIPPILVPITSMLGGDSASASTLAKAVTDARSAAAIICLVMHLLPLGGGPSLRTDTIVKRVQG